MTGVRVTGEYGLVVRRASLKERGVSWTALLAALEVAKPLDSDEFILSFGPHFGSEALATFTSRLSELGLRYFDDFFEFSGDFPKWCQFSVASTKHQ